MPRTPRRKEHMVNDTNDGCLAVSYVASQPHFVITHPAHLGSSLILRAPEFVRRKADQRAFLPGNMSWQVIAPDTHVRYEWATAPDVKAEAGIDFDGEAWSSQDELRFEITMRNTGETVNPYEVSLFCLQAGGSYRFHDYHGGRTFIRCRDGWRTVKDAIHDRWEEHRMCGFRVVAGTADADLPTARLMVKESTVDGMVLGIAVDIAAHLSCNHQIWPSCIHANPEWGDLNPGEERRACGKVYYFEGTKDELFSRYQSDFCSAKQETGT